MPGAATSQSTCAAQPPQRFRSSLDAGERKSAPGDAPVPLGMPRPRLVPKSPRSAPATPRSASNGDAAASFTPRASDTPISTNRCEVPVVSGREQPKACSIMELVNQAARREEELEAAARRGLCASPRISSSSRGASPRAAPFSPHSSSTSDSSGRDAFLQPSSGRPPVASSPRASTCYSISSAAGGSCTPRSAVTAASPRTSLQHSSASPFSAASPRAAAAAGYKPSAGAGASRPPPSPLASPAGPSAHRHAAAGSIFASPNSSRTVAGAAAAAAQQHLPAHPTGTAAARPSGFASAAAQLKLSSAAAAAGGSDCASDDGSLTPESSLCSSASNSSLCSYGSLASSSCSSLGNRPKSILMRRSHSCSSGSSSPGAPKHVRWRDGESVREDAGHDLVAVLILQDTPEIRRLRKDTWPERSKGRDLSVTIPTISSSGSSGSSAAGAEGNAANPLVATVMDWKEKLRALSAERRAQRVEALQATWTAQQAQQQRQQQERQRKQQQEQQQMEIDADADAAAGASATGEGDASGTPAAAAAGITSAAAAAAQASLVKVGAGLPSAGPVINLQAMSGSCVSQPCC